MKKGKKQFDSVKLGQFLKSKRDEKNLSLSDLVKTSGVPKTTIYKIEEGAYNSSLKNIFSICTALNIKLEAALKECLE